MLRRIFLISKWLHRYLGLLLFLYLIVVGITGILLNHPTLLSGFSVPRWMVPPSYRIVDWNRGSLKTVVYSEQDSSLGFLAGTEGVWKTTDGGVRFEPMDVGYPSARAKRRTNHLHLMEDGDRSLLLAGTHDGLFGCSLTDETWRHVPLGRDAEEIRKILEIEDRIVVFSQSNAYQSPAAETIGDLSFQRVHLQRTKGPATSDTDGISLVRLMFALHGGEIWGLPGRLLIDLVGVVLIFLSASGVYMWYFPRARRWFPRKAGNLPMSETTKRKAYLWMTRYHLDLGALVTVFLMLIAGTALFMPPSPLVLFVVRTTVPREYWPGPLPENPWHEAIGNAAYDAVGGEILIEAKKAIWRGPADFSGPFVKDTARHPISAMGTHVMEVTDDGGLLVGSFSGLFECRPDGKTVIDLSTGKPRKRGRSGPPLGRWMAVGYLETPAGERFVATHKQGILGIDGAETKGRFEMPEAMVRGYRMPLRKFLFEVHNGRIFRDWLGGSYFLISVVGALSLLLIAFTGLYDWVYRRVPARGRERVANGGTESSPNALGACRCSGEAAETRTITNSRPREVRDVSWRILEEISSK